MPSPPLRIAVGSRCARSPIPCNRIDYFTASFHIADIVLLPSTDSRGFGATIGYGTSMSLFHRIEVGIGGTAALWSQPEHGLLFQNGPALLNIKGVLFPLLRNPLLRNPLPRPALCRNPLLRDAAWRSVPGSAGAGRTGRAGRSGHRSSVAQRAVRVCKTTPPGLQTVAPRPLLTGY